MTCSRFLLNVCFVIGNLSRRFVMMCWSAASLHLYLLNVRNRVYNLTQTHAIPNVFVGFVACISRSREHNCPSYVLLERKIICPYSYTQEDIRKFESNNSLEARIGKQNVHGNKVYSGMERQKMYIWACKLFDLQVSRLPCPSLQFGLWLVNSITNHARVTLSIFFQNLLYFRVWVSDIWRGRNVTCILVCEFFGATAVTSTSQCGCPL